MNPLDTLWISAAGAAVGGFLGVLILNLVQLYIAHHRNKPVFIKEYPCAHSVNQGQKTESAGELMHHYGKVNEEQGTNNPVWEWTRDPVGNGAGECVLYGPHTTDAVEPGLYQAVFVIKAIKMMKGNDITRQTDLPLLEIDINKTTDETTITMIDDGPYSHARPYVMPYQGQQKMSRRYIRASELAVDGWQRFILPFYSDGTGSWEYRVFAYDGTSGNRPNNIREYSANDKLQILFDRVEIFRINKLTLPWHK